MIQYLKQRLTIRLRTNLHFDHDQIDVVFVPLLIFDKQGHRIGYGKGYYDRFLSKCKKDTIKVGLAWQRLIIMLGGVKLEGF